ncbi:GlxA family transcriptional regulator [Jannaschia sp. CCS1]|uniref:GlxA family transcriptional regulator n=1 Tax=Jannaschia sp. (strain CCS1) TaxID=290400 RepID=UPI000053D056|nr:helix-turn-helix domain-containing protein [Jannaschia sp. CCS1]ABD55498.1 transcriptional regulator, AraC family [Jannaschia sp. CCS1]
MTSFSAKPVLFVVYPNCVLLDLVGPLQVFTHARETPDGANAYQTHVASKSGGMIGTNTVLDIDSSPLEEWRDRPIHTLIIVGGDGVYPAAKDVPFVRQIKALADQAQRICSVCSGAILLAAAGLLDNRRAVTHWEDCDQLAKGYPDVRVEVDPIYIRDGAVWTSAGITAGIDMALAIIEEDLGHASAIDMARSLVTPMVRSGGQSQFSAELDRQARDTQRQFAPLHAWIKDNIAQKISVEDMAQICGMSGRTFARRYALAMGSPPAKALEAIRVDRARDLLSGSDQSLQAIAITCGFLDVERMRRAFLRQIHTSPSEFRKQFQLA